MKLLTVFLLCATATAGTLDVFPNQHILDHGPLQTTGKGAADGSFTVTNSRITDNRNGFSKTYARRP